MAEIIYKLRNIKGRIASLAKLQQNMGLIGQVVKQLNEKQIKLNYDSDGVKFKKYAKDYVTAPKKKRKKSGKKSTRDIKSDQMKGRQKPVNFVLRNEMMPAFDVIKVTKNSVEVGFSTTEAKRKAAWNYKTRKFIGLHKSNRKKLFQFINKLVLTDK